jgi:predicted dehydrogenase
MIEKMGVLIIGAGWVSTQHIAAFQRNTGTEVVAVCDVSRRAAEARCKEFGLAADIYEDYAEALQHPGVDLVSVCTPQHLHPQHALAAARAGKHIVIEKPVAMSREEARAMREVVRETGVKTVVSFVLRWNPMIQNMKKILASGALGRISSVEVDYCSYSGDWWGGFEVGRTRKFGGSAFLVAGCHAVDALRWFAEVDEFRAAEASEVFAWEAGLRGQSTNQYNPITHTWHEGSPLEYPALEMAMVRFKNGVLGKVSVNFECIQPYAFSHSYLWREGYDSRREGLGTGMDGPKRMGGHSRHRAGQFRRFAPSVSGGNSPFRRVYRRRSRLALQPGGCLAHP